MTGSGVLTGASKRSKRSAGFPTREIEINTGRNACAPLKPDHPPPGRPDRDRRPRQNLQIPQQTEQLRTLDRVVANPVRNRHRFTKADYNNNELAPPRRNSRQSGNTKALHYKLAVSPSPDEENRPPAPRVCIPADTTAGQPYRRPTAHRGVAFQSGCVASLPTTRIPPRQPPPNIKKRHLKKAGPWQNQPQSARAAPPPSNRPRKKALT